MTNEILNIKTKEVWQRAKAIYLSTLQSNDEKNQADRYLSMVTDVTREGDTVKILTSNAYAAELETIIPTNLKAASISPEPKRK